MLLRPGQTGPLVKLQDAARELHEHERAAVLEKIAKRKRTGANPDERTNFDALAALAKEAVAAAEKSDARTLIDAAVGIVEGTAPPLADPGEYVPHDSLDGIEVRFRALDAERSRKLQDALALQNAETMRARTRAEQTASDEAAIGIIEEYLREAVAELRSDALADDGTTVRQTIAPLTEADTKAIRFSGLLTPLYRCSLAFQTLPAKKAVRFGSSPPSISPSSATTATAASQGESVRLDAGVGPSTPTGADAIGSGTTSTPIAVPGATSSTTPISSLPSSSREPSERGASGSMDSPG